MAFYRIMSITTRDSGIAADNVVNTWHFDDDEASYNSASVGSFLTALNTFYATMNGFRSQLVGTMTHKVYDLSEPEPRVPRETSAPVTLGTSATSTTVPEECCIVLSFQGAIASGVNMRRRRGRVYLGPWATNALSDASGRVIVSSTLQTTIRDAADAMLGAIGLFGGRWAVYSPTTRLGGGSLDASMEDVTNGWVDNAWDTQRRRGGTATSRLTFS